MRRRRYIRRLQGTRTLRRLPAFGELLFCRFDLLKIVLKLTKGRRIVGHHRAHFILVHAVGRQHMR